MMMELTSEELELLQRSKLFSGIGTEKLKAMLNCLQARRQEFAPGAYVVHEGDEVLDVGMVLSGHARSLRQDAAGAPLIISLQERGSFIGVLLAASRDRKSPVSVQAQEPLSVLFIPARGLISPCGQDCPEHGNLLRNYLDSIAEKSLVLNDRIDCLIRRTVREKVMTYLTHASAEKGSREFSIPLDRSAMADYLNIERSALSRELSRMKQDGLIEYRKNHFTLLSGVDCEGNDGFRPPVKL